MVIPYFKCYSRIVSRIYETPWLFEQCHEYTYDLKVTQQWNKVLSWTRAKLVSLSLSLSLYHTHTHTRARVRTRLHILSKLSTTWPTTTNLTSTENRLFSIPSIIRGLSYCIPNSCCELKFCIYLRIWSSISNLSQEIWYTQTFYIYEMLWFIVLYWFYLILPMFVSFIWLSGYSRVLRINEIN